MCEQIIRNFKAYFRNKGSFYGSLVSMFVLLVLYALFLTDVLVDGLQAVFQSENAKAFVFAWLVCAMLTVNAINATMSAVNVMVEDEEQRKIKDFTISPFPAWKLTLSYIMAAVAAGLIVTIATLLLGFFLVLIFGKTAISFLPLLKTLPCIIVTVLAVAAVTVFAYSYVKKTSVVSVVTMIIGVMIGFLIGAYMPIGQMGKAIQVIIKCVPFTYAAVYFRAVLLKDISAAYFDGAPAGLKDGFEEMMGNVIKWGDYIVPNWLCVLIVFAVAVIFFALTVLRINMRKRKS